MASSNRYGIDRRFENDKRHVYDLNYFIDGGVERRNDRERRGRDERRVGWVKTDDWKSVYLGNLICADDFKNRDDMDLDQRAQFTQLQRNAEDKRGDNRFRIQEYAYAVLRPSSKKVGQIVDISRGGLSFRYPDTGEEHIESFELDIFLVGDDFYLDKIPFRTVSERDMDIELPDQSLTMKQCGVKFDALTIEQIERLDLLIQKYAKGKA